MALAMQQPSHNNAWEESIVPTLRKRLEQESRYLEHRLSAHSLSSDHQHQSPSPSAVLQQHQQLSRSAISPSTSRRQPSPIQRNYSQPTGIPRPSTTMTTAISSVREFPSSSSTSNDVRPQTSSSSKVRSRTRSTPYPFDPDAVPPVPSTSGRKTPNGIPTPASSRANSPMPNGGHSLQASANGQTPLKPSRIPMATRRARSNSNATSLEGTAGRPKKGSPPTVQDIYPPSPEASPDMWRDQHGTPEPATPQDLLHPMPAQSHIRDEAPIFNPNRLSRAASFEEQREFEHWYRGEGTRNGGRGEIKVAKAGTAKEMLDIAVGGHIIDEGGRWTRRRKEYGDYEMDTRTRRAAEQMDYVPDERELTDVEGASISDHHHYGTVDTHAAGTVEGPGTAEDLDDYYYGMADEEQPRVSSSSQPSGSSHKRQSRQQKRSSVLPPAAATPSRAQSPTTSSVQSHQASSTATAKPKTAATKTTPGTPRKSSAGKPRNKSQQRQRAVSKPQPAPAMADALPPWATKSPVPSDGNWDDVVLPTVAKKMGLVASDDVTMLGKEKQKQSLEDEVYEPAPGTFAYDPTKRRGPGMGPPKLFSDDFETPALPPPSPTPATPKSPVPEPIQYEYPPVRKESPPPFAQYQPDVVEAPQPPPPAHAPSPMPSREDLRARNKEMKRNKPAIVVTSPSQLEKETRRQGDIDDEGAGCCKCTIM